MNSLTLQDIAYLASLYHSQSTYRLFLRARVAGKVAEQNTLLRMYSLGLIGPKKQEGLRTPICTLTVRGEEALFNTFPLTDVISYLCGRDAFSEATYFVDRLPLSQLVEYIVHPNNIIREVAINRTTKLSHGNNLL